jgi:hypothetical protein
MRHPLLAIAFLKCVNFTSFNMTTSSFKFRNPVFELSGWLGVYPVLFEGTIMEYHIIHCDTQWHRHRMMVPKFQPPVIFEQFKH